MPATQAEIDATAQRLRSLGLPDYLNRWLTMTPKALAANEAARLKMQTNHQRRTTMTATTGPKEAALREQRTAEAKATAAEPAVTEALKANGAKPPKPKKPHPADEAIAAGPVQIEEAVSFAALLQHTAGGNSVQIKREGKTIAEAFLLGEEARKEVNSTRKVLIYAVDKTGRSRLVKDSDVRAVLLGADKAKGAPPKPAKPPTAAPAKPPRAAKPEAKAKAPAKPKATSKPAKPAPKAKAGGKAKARYDWEAAAQEAAKGSVPKAPPLAKSTGHLGQLEAVIAAAKAKDKKTLGEYRKLPPTTYGRKVVGQYAKLCLQALGA